MSQPKHSNYRVYSDVVVHADAPKFVFINRSGFQWNAHGPQSQLPTQTHERQSVMTIRRAQTKTKHRPRVRTLNAYFSCRHKFVACAETCPNTHWTLSTQSSTDHLRTQALSSDNPFPAFKKTGTRSSSKVQERTFQNQIRAGKVAPGPAMEIGRNNW